MSTTPGQFALPEEECACHCWEHLFNASEDAQVVCRPDGTLVHINPRAARRFQFAADADPASLSIFNLFGPPVDQKLGRILQARPAQPDQLHSVPVQRDGAPHALMDLEVVPLGGDLRLVLFKDSGHRMRLESHIQRLITAIDATPDVFLVTNADMKITFVNPAFQTSTGYSLEEVLGRTDDFLRAPTEQDKVSAYRDLVSHGREWIGEFVNVRRNGDTYHVESTISPIADFTGRFMGYVACERDITMRKHLQDSLRTERDFVQSILHSLDGAIYSLDCEFRLTHANGGWRHLPAEHGGIRFGGAPEIGRALLEYVPDPQRREELRALFHDVIGGGRAQDNSFHSPDGRHWLLKVSPWINGAQMRGLICNITDQTRHHELQNQLFQAQKMEIIGTLAAGVAHDFNNLLQVIRGHTSLMLMSVTDPAHRKGLDHVDMAAARATEITRQLLSFSRVSDERRIVLDLNKVMREANQLGRQTLRSNVTVELKPAPKPLRVKMDPTKASQALLNLCVNAQDAMPDGGRLTLTNIVVELTLEQVERRNLQPGVCYARCSVSDTGCGIPDDVLPRIFDPFYTTKAKGKGTGLGLPIVQRVAEEAGGFIEVESVLNQGTTFHLYLPLVHEQLSPAPAPRDISLTHGKGRVLVVDDVDLLRDFTQGFLQATGLNVLVAGSGQQAVKMLEESAEPVDLMFTDYNMPGMTGLELIEIVAGRWPRTRFVLASGFLSEAMHARVKAFNVSILAKPYDMAGASKVVMEKLAEVS